MAVRNIIAAIAALAASAGAGGAYFATSTRTTPASAEPTPHATVLVETKEAPAAEERSVKLESAGKKQRVEVQRGKGGDSVRVENAGKAERVEVKRTGTGDESVRSGDVRVERKGGGLNVKVGDLVVDTQGTH